jgi:hypothetical protein
MAFRYEPVIRFSQAMPSYNSPKSAPTYSRPTYTKTVLPSFSGTYIVTFLGGPKNGTQEFIEAAKHPYIEDGKIWLIPILENTSTEFHNPALARNDTYRYKTVFIPQNETTFTEAICILALFQP